MKPRTTPEERARLQRFIVDRVIDDNKVDRDEWHFVGQVLLDCNEALGKLSDAQHRMREVAQSLDDARGKLTVR